MRKILAFLTLFTSFSTLLCCAIPILLVTVGMGAAMASIVSFFPQIVWVSEHKSLVFLIAGALLIFNLLIRMYNSDDSCPVDTDQAAICRSSKSVSVVIFYISSFMYLIGAFFAFIAPIL